MSDAPVAQLGLEQFLPYRLNRASEIVSRRFSRHYKARYGMTRPEWRALATLGQHTQMTATEIGAHSTMHKTKVSRAVRALADRKWVERTQDEHDRRLEWLCLTRAGRAAYQDLVAVALKFERDFVALIGEDAANAINRGLDAIDAATGSELLEGD